VLAPAAVLVGLVDDVVQGLRRRACGLRDGQDVVVDDRVAAVYGVVEEPVGVAVDPAVRRVQRLDELDEPGRDVVVRGVVAVPGGDERELP
jgi:hypothetical protein